MSKSKLMARFDNMRIVRDDSPRGGVIQIPVARRARIDRARTAGGGTGMIEIDGDVFEQIVENFKTWPKPVNAYFGHASKDNPRKPDTPAIGVVTDIWAESDTLWNELNLGPKAWDLIVTQKGFNSGSIEADHDAQLPVGDFQGVAQSGLAITNDPALPVQYLAAESGATGRVSVQLSAAWLPPEAAEREVIMPLPEITLESLKSDKVALESKVATLQTEAASTATRLTTLETENADLKKRPTAEAFTASQTELETIKAENVELKKRPTLEKVLELDGKIQTIEQARLGDQVTTLVDGYVNSGKAPAFFEGAKEDPIKFLKDRFGGSLDAFKASADKLPTVANMAGRQGPGSGGGGGVSGSPREQLHTEVMKLVAEKKVPDYNAGLEQMKATNPTLWASVASGYDPTVQQI